MQSVSMRANQHLTVTATPKTDGNLVGGLSAAPDWTVDRGDLLTITPTPDGTAAVITGQGTAGTAIVTVNGQATPFPENARAISSFQVTLSALPATHFDFAFGTPVNN